MVEADMAEVEDAIVVSDETMMSMVDDARDTKAILALRAKVQKVRDEVLKEGTHYGTLPGTNKPTLYQDGGDVMGLTFRIAFTFENEFEGDGVDEIAVRSRCLATYRGELLGDCEGYASSNEEKYKWRAAVCNEEWEEADPDRRRNKWKRGSSGNYQIKQVRTEPADIVNTVVKMAQKRAKLGVIKTVLAIGEMFNVDMDDIPPEIRQGMADASKDDAPEGPKRKSETKKATKKKAAPKKEAEAPKVSTKADPDEAAEDLEQQEADDDAYTGKITEIRELKRGENANGEWVLTLIKVNDFGMTTFDKRLVSVAQSAKSFDKMVRFDYEPGPEGKDPKLTALMELD